jgi:glycerol uptake facilitator-like aquaporin
VTPPKRLGAPNCFTEADPHLALARRAMAEFAGTLFLMLVVVGVGLATRRGSPTLGVMAGALGVAGALVGLIIAFGQVSGGHFNPLITFLQWLSGLRDLSCTIAYVAAQVAGGIAGALTAALMFGAFGPSSVTPLMTPGLAASEFIASAGLMIIVFGCTRGGRTDTAPFAVGAWLAAAIMATPSGSYANPAIALAAIFAVGPASLPAGTAFLYVLVEVVGGLLALATVKFCYPARSGELPVLQAAAENDR